MQDCHVTNASIIATSYNIGGLTGGVLTNSTMTRCSYSGVVVGQNQVGGLSGTAWNQSSITESYSEGTVSGGYLIGGLVGYCTFSFGPPTQNIINNCYSRSIVTANTGRAGGIYGGSDATLILSNSYSTGAVSAPEFAGGVIGAYGAGIDIQNTFFDMETSGQTEGVGGYTGAPATPGIEARTTANMKTNEFLNLLNSGSNANLWSLETSLNDGYPILTSLLSIGETTFETPIVTVYPTIFTDMITVSTIVNLKSFKIYNIMGAMVQEGNFNGNNTIQPRNLSSGVYIIEINTENTTITKKLIKK